MYYVYVLILSGSGVLVLTTTEVDKTGASYYGEQGLHYLSAKGEGNIVLLGMYVVVNHKERYWLTGMKMLRVVEVL